MNKNDLHLKRNPTLRDFQEHVAKMIKERGLDKETVHEVFMYLLDICNYFKIDLEKSFRDKEEINKKRFWE